MTSSEAPDNSQPTADPSSVSAQPTTAAPPQRLPAQHPYAAQIAAVQQQQPGTGPIGKVRETGTCMLLTLVTLGIYALVWYYHVHEEMKRHTGDGLGGGLALVIAFFIGIVSPYLASSEVGNMYERRSEHKPVSGTTGLWYFPGIFLLLIGPFVWFVKTNGALNVYWRSLGAR